MVWIWYSLSSAASPSGIEKDAPFDFWNEHLKDKAWTPRDT